MKRRFTVLFLILAMVLCAATAAYGLDLEMIAPKDGAKNCQPANMAIKFRFDEEMYGAADIDKNAVHFKVTDPEGVVQPFKMVYSEKYPNQLWLILNDTLQADTEYTVSVSAGISALSGAKTTDAKTFTFKTRDTHRDSIISTVLMLVMMAMMGVMSVLAARKKNDEDKVMTVAQAEKLNPYKIAKQKGWSIEQANSYVEKEKEKARKAEEKAAEAKRKREQLTEAEMAEIEAELDAEERRNGWFKVKSQTSGSFKAHDRKLPKQVTRKFAARRKAEEERAKRYAKNKKKK